MKSRDKEKKLVLSKETLRGLDTRDLSKIRGGGLNVDTAQYTLGSCRCTTTTANTC